MSSFIRLVDYNSSNEKEKEFHNKKNRIVIEKHDDFNKIPGNPIVYWVSNKLILVFNEFKSLKDIGEPRRGLQTGNKDQYIRYFFETQKSANCFDLLERDEAIKSNYKWFLFNSGGEYRKWYGNMDFIVNWKNNGEDIKKNDNAIIPNEKLYFREGITWSRISTVKTGFRIQEQGIIPGDAGPCIYVYKTKPILSYLNSCVAKKLLEVICPTLTFQTGDMGKIPVKEILEDAINQKICNITEECVSLSKEEWDSRETSWDFTKNKLVTHKTDSGKIKDSYKKYCEYWKDQFYKLQENEEKLNKIFIEIYGLEEELTPEVPLEEITILKDETKIENNELVFKKEVIIKQFLSYVVGCILGRYSPDKEGLILANQGETLVDFKEQIPNPSFLPDPDDIVPALDDEYFEDDIISRFKEFLKTTFGADTLYENLEFIAEALGKRSSENAENTIRRYLLNDFYSDHCKMYKKRPIYWLFASGPEKAFNALIYMHRYNKETLAKMRIDYLIRFEEKLEAKKATLKTDSSDPKIRQKALNEQTKINKKLQEIRRYDEKLKHLADQYIEIDLDDGVKKNYKLFKEITAKI